MGLRQFIPKHIKDHTLLAVLDFFSRPPVLWSKHSRQKMTEQHFTQNEKLWQTSASPLWFNETLSNPQMTSGNASSPKKYIEKQSALFDFYYGKPSAFLSKLFLNGKPLRASENSCEVIAVYNAIYHLTRKGISFPALLRDFELDGLTFGGFFGTSPLRLVSYLEKHGFICQAILGDELRKKKMPQCRDVLPQDNSSHTNCNDTVLTQFSNSYDTFLLTVYNDGSDLMAQIHTMCITKEDSQYFLHNGGKYTEGYASLKDVIGGYRNGRGKVIQLVGVKM